MFRTGILIFLLLAVLVGLAAETYAPRIDIPGYTPLVYNKLDVWTWQKGLTAYKPNPFMVSDMPINTQELVVYDKQIVYLTAKFGEYQLYPTVTMSFDEYFKNLYLVTLRSSLTGETVSYLSSKDRATQGGLVPDLVIDLPAYAMPKGLRTVFGGKPPVLSLDGSQKLTFTGTSTKRERVSLAEQDNASQFDVEMKQDLNLQLKGTIGEKITVNLSHNSNQDSQLLNPNNIKVEYKGFEDEVVKSVEAGNITLALNGSNYISYSASSQGLFGVKTLMKFGDLELTTIMSTEEGQKNTQKFVGQSRADSLVVSSENFMNRTIFYTVNPHDLFSLYEAGEQISGVAIPRGWVDNAIKTDNQFAWLVKAPDLLPKPEQFQLFLDDNNNTNNVTTNAKVGQRIITASGDSYIPYYDELVEGTDYSVDFSTGMITIQKQILDTYTLGVRYIQKNGVSVPAESSTDTLYVKVLRKRSQIPQDVTWVLQARNIYSLNMQNIVSEGFSLDVFQYDTNGKDKITSLTGITNYPWDTFIKYLRLDTSGNGAVNGEDITINLKLGYVIFPFLTPFYSLGDSLIYSKTDNSIYPTDYRPKMKISAKGKIGQDQIRINQMNLLPGSVKVRVNGVTLKENTEYLVDYDFGEVTFLTSVGKNPDDKIEIDYEFRSGFAVEKKTMIGMRADYKMSDITKFGGTIIYRSETVADKRPKIGNENMQLILADIDGMVTVQPNFLTRWVDAMPFISTDKESKVTLSGEVAMSVPTIYGEKSGKKKEAFLDDMEGILESFPLSVNYATWQLGSKPYNISYGKARTYWFGYDNYRMKDVYPEETLSAKEKNDKVAVMRVKLVPPTISQPGVTNKYWGGIMKYLGNENFTEKKYIEFLVKVDEAALHPTIMHIDLGDINEDFYTEYGGAGVLNTEDKNNDGEVSAEEDIGLDGVVLGSQMNPNPGADPNDVADINKVNGEPKNPNGTENNNTLDTEDLNGDLQLNTLDRYLEYSVSISDGHSEFYQGEQQPGWRLFRIPIGDLANSDLYSNSVAQSTMTLERIKYARVWFEVEGTTRIDIVNLDIVGNKWEEDKIYNAVGDSITALQQLANNETFRVSVTDNRKNKGYYVSPPGSVEIDQDIEALEQSLSLVFENLQANHTGYAYQSFREGYNLLSYEKMMLWVYPQASTGTGTYPDSVDIVIRLGADKLNYYQVKKRLQVKPSGSMLQPNWSELEIPFKNITRVKSDASDSTFDGYVVSLRGTPSLTNIKEVYFGLGNVVTDGSISGSAFTGVVHFDEVRVGNPYEEVGFAARATLNTQFADLMTFDMELERKTPNFITAPQRGRTLSSNYETQTSLKMNNKYFLDRFFPEKWGLDFPLSLSRNTSYGVPRFKTNSDILRSNLLPEDKEREKKEDLTYTGSVGLKLNKTPKSKWLLYTAKNTTFSSNISYTEKRYPTTVDTSLAYGGTVTYKLDLPKEKLGIKPFKNYTFYFAPKTFDNSFTFSATEPRSYSWLTTDTLSYWKPVEQTVNSRLAKTINAVAYDITTDLSSTYRLATTRDLTQENKKNGLNMGLETEYGQDITFDYSPGYFDRFFTVSTNGNVRFSETQRSISTFSLPGAKKDYARDGNTARSVKVVTVLKNADILRSLSTGKPIAKDTRPKDPNSVDPLSYYYDDDKANLSDEELKDKLKKEMEQNGRPPDDKDMPKPPRKDPEKKVDIDKEVDQKAELKLPDMADSLSVGDDSTLVADSTKSKGKSQVAKNASAGIDFSFKDVMSYLSKFKNISTTYQNDYSMAYTRRKSRPDFAFQIGVPHALPDSLLDSRGVEDSYSLASGLTLSSTIDTDIRFSQTITRRYANASNLSISTTFPDIGVTVSEFQRFLKLEKLLTSSRVNSGYQYTKKETGDIDWVRPKNVITTSSFSPLVSWTGNWVKNISTNVAYNISHSKNVSNSGDQSSYRTTDSNSLNGQVSYSFTAEKGFKLPFMKRKIQFKNELTSSLNFSYENNQENSVATNGKKETTRDDTKLTIAPTATYTFHQSVKGGLTSSFEKTNNKEGRGVRTFSLGVWVEITF